MSSPDRKVHVRAVRPDGRLRSSVVWLQDLSAWKVNRPGWSRFEWATLNGTDWRPF